MPNIVEKDLGSYNKTDPLLDFGKVGDNLSGGIESVYTTFKSLNQSMENVHLVKGFFNDTLALNKSRCGKIAVLRIDADWYESCKICLDELYDQVVEGGVIISDDYGHFIGAKRAVDEFRELRGITSPLIQIDYCEFYWIKGASEANQFVGKSYNWGSGYIKFYKDHLETTWGRGIYTIKDAYTVTASWHGHEHVLQFNDTYTKAISIRTAPDDCIVSSHSIYYSPKQTIDPLFNISTIDTNYIRGKKINYIKTDYLENDTCIGATIKRGIYWELWMLNYIQSHYIKGTHMIDLGGNIGTTSMLMSEVVSQGCKIYTFEPLYSDILVKNVIDNNLMNSINVYPYGLGNKHDTLKIKNVDFNSNMNFGAVSLIDRLDTGKDHLDISIFPLDFFQFENVSLIKIDVEHMEIDVLEGSYDLIQRCKPTILIETYQLDRFKASSIFKKLVDLRYTLKPIPEGYHDYILSTK
jgi:FkbM family methyltransferase